MTLGRALDSDDEDANQGDGDMSRVKTHSGKESDSCQQEGICADR
jgi:hypothetical protein